MRTPAIRAKGFMDDWEQRKLGDLCVEFKSGDFIRADEIASFGAYPVYGGNGLRGYTDRYNHEGDYALIGRQGALCGNLNFSSGKAYFTEHAIAVKAAQQNDTQFLFYCFENMNLGQYSGQSAQPGLAVSKLVELTALVPNKKEQEQISAILKNLDTLIILNQRKLDKLVLTKSAMLRKMFPQNGATVPEIRFKGFSEKWEKHPFGFFFDERDERSGEGELISVTISSGIKKFSELNRSAATPDDMSKYKVVCKGDIAYNSMRMWQGASGYSPYTGILSPAYTVLKPKGNTDARFFSYLMKKPEVIHLFEINSQGLTKDTWNLKFPVFSQIETYAPATIEEQKTIACFFSDLDNLISLQEAKVEKLKNTKKALLRKMFV